MVRDRNELYVIVRDRGGRVVHKAIGRAIVEAEEDASLTMLALRQGIEPLAISMRTPLPRPLTRSGPWRTSGT